MTKTARRRWTRELQSEIDGIALGAKGPVLLHGYDAPAGGRWEDDFIPGKLATFDRSTGQPLWISPCEVGYGRGFGAGFGNQEDALVLGPSANGHRVVRMSLVNGELIDVGRVPAFDEASVYEDVCLCVSARRITAVDSATLKIRWTYERDNERYHRLGRIGSRVFVVYTQLSTKKQGVLMLDAQSGDFEGLLMSPSQKSAPNREAIPDLAVEGGAVILVVRSLTAALPRDVLLELLMKHPETDASAHDGLALLALDPRGKDGARPLWFENLRGTEDGELPEISISTDSDKLYLVRGAFLEVRDCLTGRALGEWTVPGLDERVAWKVSSGAGLLAEETRVSIFELPA